MRDELEDLLNPEKVSSGDEGSSGSVFRQCLVGGLVSWVEFMHRRDRRDWTNRCWIGSTGGEDYDRQSGPIGAIEQYNADHECRIETPPVLAFQ